MHAMMTACSRLVRRPYVVTTRGQKHDRCSQSRYHSSRCTDVTKLCHRLHTSDTIQQTERAKLMPDMTTKLHKFISMHLLQWRPNMAAHIIYTDV